VYEGDIKTSLGRKVDDGICKITSPVFSFLVDDLASGNNILYTHDIRTTKMPKNMRNYPETQIKGKEQCI
jgi:hypothetical protein